MITINKKRNKNKKSLKWWIGASACALLFVIIGTFAYMKMDFLWKGVNISAHVERSATAPLVEVTGQAAHATYLSLNGREIFIDKDGSFDEQVALLPGLSVMTLSAQDKFGKSTDKKIEVMYQAGAGTVATRDTIINTN